MAGINVKQAQRELLSPAFVTSAALIVAGALLSQAVTSFLRNNFRDIDMQGGDAVYAVVAAVLAAVVLPMQYGKPIALGSTATAMRVVLSEYGVV